MVSVANLQESHGKRSSVLKFLARVSREAWRSALLSLLVLPVLYAVHLYNHTLSHSMAEIFSAFVAFSIFLFTWNSRPFLTNRYYLFIGAAFFFVGALDFIHAEAYEGMFQGDGANLPAQLWYAARYLQAASLLIAPMFCDRQFRASRILAGYGAVALALMGSIFVWPVFPDVYIEGIGVTGFKTFSDYFVCLLLLGSMGTLYRKREHFDGGVLRILYASVAFSIASELAFHLYRDYYVYNNLVGHYFKIVSSYLFYKALIATGLFRPYDVIFRNLTRSEAELRESRDVLEARVEDRTSELRRVNERLERELAERQWGMEMRQLILDFLQLTESVRTVREFLSSLSTFLQERIGCEAIGIRYRTNGDFPYLVTRGFSEEFVDAESSLCSPDRRPADSDDGEGAACRECICGAVISGRVDPSLPFITRDGAFWTNDASDLLATNEAIRTLATRGRCVRQGYESIALVPLRMGAEPIGLLQFNDRRKGMFPPNRLAQLERIAENVASVLGRLLAQEALRGSEDRFRTLVENSPVGTLIVQEGKIIYRNPEQLRLLGPLPAGSAIRSLGNVLPEDAPKFEALCAAMETGLTSRCRAELRFSFGDRDSSGMEIRWVHCQATPIEYQGKGAVLVSMADFTRVRELEQVVAAREKMASLGQLAAGIAHEIRNPLSGINLNISTLEQLCRSSPDISPEQMEQIETVIGHAASASEKIASVIRSVMEFSKPVPRSLYSVNANRVVEKAVAFSAVAMRKRGIELAKTLDSGRPVCLADPRLLEQVLVNLITNASQALESVDGARRIEVSSARENGAVVLRVADSGPGVPIHLREKIFDPFFTTRKDGHGIGLSFSHRVISEHGGALTVAASGIGGAEFRIELPQGNREHIE